MRKPILEVGRFDVHCEKMITKLKLPCFVHLKTLEIDDHTVAESARKASAESIIQGPITELMLMKDHLNAKLALKCSNKGLIYKDIKKHSKDVSNTILSNIELTQASFFEHT